MKQIILSISLSGFLAVMLACSSSSANTQIKSEAACLKQQKYWYKDKCWDYTDDSIPASEIDSLVDETMAAFQTAKFTIGDREYPLQDIELLPTESGNLGLTFVYDRDGKSQSAFIIVNDAEKQDADEESQTDVSFFNRNILLEEQDGIDDSPFQQGLVVLTENSSGDIVVEGTILDNNGKPTTRFAFTGSPNLLGMGSTQIKVVGDEAYLSGILGTHTYHQITKLIEEQPKVKTIVLTEVPGSINDAVNMHTGRLLRQNGFATKLLSNSDVSSGGVDLFTSGVERIFTRGGKLGVHSWCCVGEAPAGEVDKDHPAHKNQLEYFAMMLGEQQGRDFYFYTLKAAPFDGIHYMAESEIKSRGIATQIMDALSVSTIIYYDSSQSVKICCFGNRDLGQAA